MKKHTKWNEVLINELRELGKSHTAAEMLVLSGCDKTMTLASFKSKLSNFKIPYIPTDNSNVIAQSATVSDDIVIDNYNNEVKTERKTTTRKNWERKSFEEHLSEYIEFKAKYGRNPKSGIPEEKSLYNWMFNQTARIKAGKLSSDKIALLEKAGVDIPNRGNQAEYLKEKGIVTEEDYCFGAGDNISARMQNYLAKVESARNNFPERGTYFYKWISIQFAHNGAALKDWQRDAWIAAGFKIKAFSCGRDKSGYTLTEGRKKAWVEKYTQYASFIKETGRIPRNNKECKEEAALYYWKHAEIKAILKNTRTDEQISYLKKVGIAA